MKKLEIIGKIMVPILLVVLVGLMVVKGKEQKEQQQVLAEQANYITNVKRTMTQKNEEIQELKEKREIELNTKVSIALCIDQMELELYSEIKPLFDDYGLKGTFVIQNGLLPDSENTITKAQYEELLEAGWDVAIGNWDDLDLNRDEDRQVWTERLDELIEQMETEKFSIPKSYYFERNAYAEECEEILKERGFQLICHFGEAGSFYGLNWNEEWNPIGVNQISQTNLDLEKIMKDLEKHKAATVLSTRYIGTLEDTSLDCSISSYRTVLDAIQELLESERIEVLTLSELYKKRLKTYIDANEEDDSYIKELQQDEKELQELQEEWDTIFKERNLVESSEEETEDTTIEEKESTTEENTTVEETTKKEKNKEETSKEEASEEKTTSTEKLDANFSAEE